MQSALGSPIDGLKSAGFERVVDAFRRTFGARGELGGAVAVTVDGSAVVDLWGGWRGPDRQRAWDRQTLTNVRSATQGLMAICVLQLVENGDLDLEAPAARYWPELAGCGGSIIPVCWLLSRCCGVSGTTLDSRMTSDARLDLPILERRFVEQKLSGELAAIGSRGGMSYGYLVGRVIERSIGQTTSQFFAANVAAPLNVDVHIGVDSRDLSRCSAFGGFMSADDRSSMKMPPVSTVELGGYATALGLATVYGALADGSGRLLTPDTIELGRARQGQCVEVAAGLHGEFGLGFALGGEQRGFGPNPRAFGYGSHGGSVGFADPEHGIGFAYVTNGAGSVLRDDPRTMALVDALYSCL
ncbi:serine hydrolase domain-containing protein [Amycolatopsis sp. NPDC051903]|uniref:serine hydrolase domain-containing protein n=1 Tax=Amycolatopsis sp. NPDC051903 TaxID=3363936 RepID=UPI00379ED3A0